MKLLKGKQKLFLATDLFNSTDGPYYHLIKNQKFIQSVKSFSDYYYTELLDETFYLHSIDDLVCFYKKFKLDNVKDSQKYATPIYGDLYLIDSEVEKEIDILMNYKTNVKQSFVKKFLISTEEIPDNADINPTFNKDVLCYFLNIDYFK